MKAKIVIFLVSMYLITSTEFHQVLKLPLLVKHYVEHQEKVNDITFWEFLVMHYKTDVAHDDQDMSLPFKDCHHSITAQALAMPTQKISLDSQPTMVSRRLPIFTHTQFLSSYPGEIFQPPRI